MAEILIVRVSLLTLSQSFVADVLFLKYWWVGVLTVQFREIDIKGRIRIGKNIKNVYKRWNLE